MLPLLLFLVDKLDAGLCVQLWLRWEASDCVLVEKQALCLEDMRFPFLLGLRRKIIDGLVVLLALLLAVLL